MFLTDAQDHSLPWGDTEWVTKVEAVNMLRSHKSSGALKIKEVKSFIMGCIYNLLLGSKHHIYIHTCMYICTHACMQGIHTVFLYLATPLMNGRVLL